MIKLRGVAYYPEYWPQERWDEDIRLMKQAHINIVRIGEFAWTAMEPAQGQFDLDWLHKIVAKFGRAGIDVMMCTPTSAPPAWLTSNHPEVCLVQRDGVRAHHGRRHHNCPTHPTYRAHCARITTQLATEFSKYRNVVAWQIDNELGPERGNCYCEHCAGEFRAWLMKRYGTLAAVNAAWQTRFWSMDFTQWNQIHHRQDERNLYPSIELDVKRFLSDCYIDFAADQVKILRRMHRGATITSNMMGPIMTPINYYKLSELFDACSDDLYFDIATMSADACACDVFRCMAPGKPFWITETGAGALTSGKEPHGEQIRAWMYSSLARGSEAHFIFRWRTCLSGQEQELQGVLETTGRPRRRFAAVQKMFTEVDRLAGKLGKMPLPKADVAIVSSHDAHWAYDAAAAIGSKVAPLKRLYALYDYFYSRNVMVDVIPPQRDFSKYKLLVLPSLCIVDDEVKARIKAFVKAGGTVLATPQLASRDMNNNYVPRTAPDGMNDLFGLAVEARSYLDNACEADSSLWAPGTNVIQEKVAVTFGDERATGEADSYIEDIELKTASALARYESNIYAGQPAATVNKFGKGAAFYLATFLDARLTGLVLEHALDRAGVKHGPEAPHNVEVIRRGKVTFAINHTTTPTSVEVPSGEVILGEVTDGTANLPAYGVCIVKVGKRN